MERRTCFRVVDFLCSNFRRILIFSNVQRRKSIFPSAYRDAEEMVPLSAYTVAVGIDKAAKHILRRFMQANWARLSIYP
jgi:hypothetical protein